MRYFVMIGFDREEEAFKFGRWLFDNANVIKQNGAEEFDCAVGMGERFAREIVVTDKEQRQSQTSQASPILLEASNQCAAELGLGISNSEMMTIEIKRDPNNNDVTVRRSVSVFLPYSAKRGQRDNG